MPRTKVKIFAERLKVLLRRRGIDSHTPIPELKDVTAWGFLGQYLDYIGREWNRNQVRRHADHAVRQLEERLAAAGEVP